MTLERSPDALARRKQRLLTRESPSAVRSIADVIVIKDAGLYFLTDREGEVPFDTDHGLGLYYRDCRYLNGYRIRLAGTRLDCLGASDAKGFGATLALTNPRIEDGKTTIPKERISVRWERVIDESAGALRDELRIRNHSVRPVRFTVSLEFRSDFEDVLAVRGLLEPEPGRLHPPCWQDAMLLLCYDGTDGLRRSTRIELDPAPHRCDGVTAQLDLELDGGATRTLAAMISVAEEPLSDAPVPRVVPEHRAELESHPEKRLREQVEVERILQIAREEWLTTLTRVDTDSVLMDRVLRTSLRDLGMLVSRLRGREYFAAGIPWFVALFGRDSAISSLQTLAFAPHIAADTLRLLADYQGVEHDDFPEEQPGKILHALRVGEMARNGSIPYTPYYGSVDATPLFLILLATHAGWTGDLGLLHELREPVERALRWVTSVGADQDGLIRYTSPVEGGIVNQGWKDAGDSIVDRNGRVARPPIAMVEVQAYAARACRLMAELLARAGEGERAPSLEQHAGKLERMLEERFWSDELGTYDMALQAGDEPTGVASSNAGHVLWARAAPPERARRTVERLMRPDMFSGWGVRTLSSDGPWFNPVAYHRGTVWPHDNSLIVAGFRAYGHDEEALRVLEGILSAAMSFEQGRLPELFAGFSRDDLDYPVRYPVACHPQAWAAGAAPYMLTTLLGLRAEGFERRLVVERPILPGFVDRLTLRGLRAAGGECDLHFIREGRRGRVEVERAENLEVIVEEA